VAQAVVPDFDERLTEFQSATFTRLRPGQRQVLGAYAEHHLGTSDLAIEMPTGEGKTLLALLIADYALDRGWSVAYLTGTRQLAERVEKEAAELGLDIVRFAARDYGGAKLDNYHQARAVGVMNYWVYFNSKPVPKPADLVIFDDAHLAEQPLSGLQTLRIPDKLGPARVLYRTICEFVVAHTDAYAGLRAMLDGTARPGTPPELLSFSDWAAIAVRHATPSSRRPSSARTRPGTSGRPSGNTSASAGFSSGPLASRSVRTTRRPRSTPGIAGPSSGSTCRPRWARWTTCSGVSAAARLPD